LKQRPQWKGLPVPFIATIRDDGTADFRVTDDVRRLDVIRWKHCQLCGQPLGRYCFFVGGIISANQNAYFEPAAHLDCLIYAMQVCPFIVGNMQHADLEDVKKDNPDRTVLIDDTYTPTKSGLWVITKADGWGYVTTPGGTVLLRPHVLKKSPVLKPPEMKPADWNIVMKDLMT
jgi:hypothetical protein